MAAKVRRNLEHFELEIEGTSTLLTYTLSSEETIDIVALRMMDHNKIDGLLPMRFLQINEKQTLKYDTGERKSLETLLKDTDYDFDIISLMKSLANTLLTAADYMIAEESFVFQPEYIFVEKDGSGWMICLPTENRVEMSFQDFCSSIIKLPRFAWEMTYGHFSSVGSFLNKKEFTVKEFAKLLENVKLEEAVDSATQKIVLKQEERLSKSPEEKKRSDCPRAEPVKYPNKEPIILSRDRRQDATRESGTVFLGSTEKNMPIRNPNNGPIILSGDKRRDAAQESGTVFLRSTEKSMPVSNPDNGPIILSGDRRRDATQESGTVFLPSAEKSIPVSNPHNGSIVSNGDRRRDATQESGTVFLPSTEKSMPVSNPHNGPIVSSGDRRRDAAQESGTVFLPSTEENMPVNNRDKRPTILIRDKKQDAVREDVPLQYLEDEEKTALLDDEATAYLLHGGFARGYLVRISTRKKVEITKNEFSIGKSRRNDVDYRIDGNRAISRYHAKIIQRGNVFSIVDTNSKNHTYINQKMIESNQEIVLKNRTQIRLADEDFVFFIEQP